MLDKVYWLRKSCTRDIVAIVSNNLLFTSLQISDEPFLFYYSIWQMNIKIKLQGTKRIFHKTRLTFIRFFEIFSYFCREL